MGSNGVAPTLGADGTRRVPATLAATAAAVVAVMVALFPAFVQADDVVVFRGGRDGAQTIRRAGAIRDYTGAGLVIVSATGREETIPPERVIEIKTTATSQETDGDAYYAAQDYVKAIDAYRLAKRTESRPWVLRRVMARLVSAYEQQGEFDAAGDEMLALLASDPDTVYFSALPLAWRTIPLDPATTTKAKSWLAMSNQPAAALLGASYLLAGPDRQQAINVLERLSTDLDLRIARLASAQLWRTKVVTASEADADKWREQAERIPPEVRGGPLLVVGDLLARHRRHEDALLSYLKIALVHNERRTLAAEGLFAAARLFEKLSRPQDSARLHRELLAGHTLFAERNEIAARLEALHPSP